jgi:hypothetical protein
MHTTVVKQELAIVLRFRRPLLLIDCRHGFASPASLFTACSISRTNRAQCARGMSGPVCCKQLTGKQEVARSTKSLNVMCVYLLQNTALVVGVSVFVASTNTTAFHVIPYGCSAPYE